MYRIFILKVCTVVHHLVINILLYHCITPTHPPTHRSVSRIYTGSCSLFHRTLEWSSQPMKRTILTLGGMCFIFFGTSRRMQSILVSRNVVIVEPVYTIFFQTVLTRRWVPKAEKPRRTMSMSSHLPRSTLSQYE